jgi:uncharacterized protein (TIGR02284 family)
MADHSERAVLNHLIETCRDAERGFRMAADQVEAPELRTLFLRMADQRRQFGDALLPHAQRLGGASQSNGTNAAALHRAWIQVKARLAADADAAVLAEAARGERFAVAAYDHAVAEMLPPDTRDLVEEQDDDVRAAAQQIASALTLTLH